MSRAIAIAAVVGASVLAVPAYRCASGPHRVQALAAGATAPAEYTFADAAPTHHLRVVKPVVDRYLEDVPRGARVLDIGCGNGALLASYAARDWRRVGIDISESGIQQARRAYPDVRFELADATRSVEPVLGPGAFDAAISTEVIEHVALPRALLENAYRVLRPGGTLVISTPYHGYLKSVAIALTGRSDTHYDPLWDHGHVKFFSVRTLGRALADAGFTDLEFTGAGKVPYFWSSMVFRARKPAGAPAAHR